MAAKWQVNRYAYMVLFGHLKGTYHLEDQVMDGSTVLQWR